MSDEKFEENPVHVSIRLKVYTYQCISLFSHVTKSERYPSAAGKI